MDGRSLTGLIVVIFGFILLGIGTFIRGDVIFFIGFYSLILIIVGLVIIFNKKEDKIEEINYSKMKGGNFK